MKLSIAVDGFLLSKRVAGCSPNTLRNYRHNLRRFETYLQNDPALEDIRVVDIRQFLDHLLGTEFDPAGFGNRKKIKLSAKTVRNVHTCLSSLWTWAIQEGYADRHIVRAVQAPKPEPPVIEPFTQEQIKALLDATRYSRPWSTSPDTQTELPKELRLRDRALILCLLDTGMRATELGRLTVGDLDLESGSVKVRGKGRRNAGQGKSRVVYLGTRARKAMWQYLAEREALRKADLPLFTTRDGGLINRNHLRTHLVRVGKRAGVDDSYPHRFRHTFAINYLRNGGDVYTLENLLGHTSLEMVKRYLALAQADAQTAHRRASPVDNWRL